MKKTSQVPVSDKVFDAVLLVVLLILLITLYPVYFVLISSFSDPVAVAGGDVTFWPVGLPWKGIRPYSKDSAIVRRFFQLCRLYCSRGFGQPVSHAADRLPLSRRVSTAQADSDDLYVTMFVQRRYGTHLSGGAADELLNTMWALILPEQSMCDVCSRRALSGPEYRKNCWKRQG